MREPIVSRTVVSTKVTVLALDTEKCEPVNLTTLLPKKVEDKDKILKMCRKKLDTETTSVAKIVDVEYVEKLLAMKEDDFINSPNTFELDPETRKALEN